MSQTTISKFEEWAVVEIMGHKRFAGLVTEQAVGGASFLRIDVPQLTLPTGETLAGFTKLFGASSIYCISPCTEGTARAFAQSIRAEGFSRFEAPRLPAIDSRPAAEQLDVLDDDEGLDDDDFMDDEEPDWIGP